jgi:hypothetical protein
MRQHVEYMQEIIMLTTCVLTEFHGFSVFFIAGTRIVIWSFSRDQRERFHQKPNDLPPRTCTTQEEHVDRTPDQIGLGGCADGPLMAAQPHYGIDMDTTWWLCLGGSG